MRVGHDGDVVVTNHLGDLEGAIRDQGVGAGRPLVSAFLDDVLPDRCGRGHRRKPDECGVRLRKRDLERVVIERLQPERGERRIDVCGVALGVHDRDLVAVEDAVGEERTFRSGQARIDQALPRVNEILRLDRGAIGIRGVATEVKDEDVAAVRDVIALRGGRHHSTQVRRWLQQRLGDRAQDSGLVWVLRLAWVERTRLVLEQQPERLVLGELWPLGQGTGIARREHGRHEQRQGDGAKQPGAWDHLSIISGSPKKAERATRGGRPFVHVGKNVTQNRATFPIQYRVASRPGFAGPSNQREI